MSIKKNQLLMPICSCNKSKKIRKKDDALQPPNIILVFTDGQGHRDVDTFGADDIATPNLGQMAFGRRPEVYVDGSETREPATVK